jgi:hypothetical protein
MLSGRLRGSRLVVWRYMRHHGSEMSSKAIKVAWRGLIMMKLSVHGGNQHTNLLS